MQAPDHDARDSAGRGLQGNQITDTGLVPPAAVVDHEYVALGSGLERLQEDVHAARVLSRQYSPGNARPDHGRHRHRAYRNPTAKTRIGDMRRRQPREPLQHPQPLSIESATPSLGKKGKDLVESRLIAGVYDQRWDR